MSEPQDLRSKPLRFRPLPIIVWRYRRLPGATAGSLQNLEARWVVGAKRGGDGDLLVKIEWLAR